MMRKSLGTVEWEKYIIPAAVVIGGYFVLKNLGILGSQANSSNNDSVTASTAAATAASIAQAKAAGNVQVVSDAQLAGMADTIYQAGTDTPVDQDTIVMQVLQVRTIVDLLRLIQLFGTKQAGTSWYSACALIGINCPAFNLQSFINSTLDSSHLNQVNNGLSSLSINYHF